MWEESWFRCFMSITCSTGRKGTAISDCCLCIFKGVLSISLLLLSSQNVFNAEIKYHSSLDVYFTLKKLLVRLFPLIFLAVLFQKIVVWLLSY